MKLMQMNICMCLLASGILNSYTMGTSGLLDIYTRSLKSTGLRAEGVYIRQIMSAYGITTK